MKVSSSSYVENERYNYALYVLQHRAIPSMADGLKSGARRLLWAGRNGEKLKSTTLAGIAMPYHPHGDQSLANTINTLAMPYNNNMCLIDGIGAFGTRLKPGACGASRYTSVKLSKFTKQVLFADLDIIPLQDNYDNTKEEPVHFLPLVPLGLLNPSEGIAVGFASTILPRTLEDIVNSQIKHLQGVKRLKEPDVTFLPLNQTAVQDSENPKRRTFYGKISKFNTSTVLIDDIGFGMSHEAVVKNLIKLLDDGTINSYEDNSRDYIEITVKMERNKLSEYTEEELGDLFKINKSINENMIMIDFDGVKVRDMNYVSMIQEFTDWRLQYYIPRYQKLKDELTVQIQRYIDVITAIDNETNKKLQDYKSRQDLIKYLATLGIVHTDYVADLAVYRFTKEEKAKIEKKLEEANALMAEYNTLLKSEDARKKVYISELKDILKTFKA